MPARSAIPWSSSNSSRTGGWSGRWTGLSETLRGILSDRELVGEYSAANLLIATGNELFAFRRFRRNGDYYTLYLNVREGLSVVASEPLDEDPGWRLLADGELVELSQGAPRSVLLPLPG